MGGSFGPLGRSLLWSFENQLNKQLIKKKVDPSSTVCHCRFMTVTVRTMKKVHNWIAVSDFTQTTLFLSHKEELIEKLDTILIILKLPILPLSMSAVVVDKEKLLIVIYSSFFLLQDVIKENMYDIK